MSEDAQPGSWPNKLAHVFGRHGIISPGHMENMYFGFSGRELNKAHAILTAHMDAQAAQIAALERDGPTGDFGWQRGYPSQPMPVTMRKALEGASLAAESEAREADQLREQVRATEGALLDCIAHLRMNANDDATCIAVNAAHSIGISQERIDAASVSARQNTRTNEKMTPDSR